MIRNFIIATALLFSATANAEYNAKKPSDVRPAAAKVSSQPLTIEGMLSKINGAYMTGMQRCYTKALAHDASLGGKVTVTFTINPWGRVTGTVSGIAPTVDSCLSSQVSTWRFPPARDSKGAYAEASFKLSLMLRK